MKHLGLITKCVATTLLGIAFVVIAGLIVVMTPLYLALSMKGNHSKLGNIVPIIPLGIIGSFIWKIWKTEPLTDTEKAYYDGIRKGQIKAARNQGIEDGMKLIAKPEDLSIKPVYALTKKAMREDIPF